MNAGYMCMLHVHTTRILDHCLRYEQGEKLPTKLFPMMNYDEINHALMNLWVELFGHMGHGKKLV